MSKKHRRASGNFQTASTPVTTPTQSGFRSNNPTDFNPDYSFVIKDLRKIGILAVFFITVLVILSFILK